METKISLQAGMKWLPVIPHAKHSGKAISGLPTTLQMRFNLRKEQTIKF
jgi:hypothetical protein